jgi:V-type H+-transporting ATPase subunit a
MKMAIIFGMMQMILGLVINVYNYNHFNKRRSIYTNFIPQITFLLSIFGYLVILIFYKWFADWSEFSPPGLLNTLIYMFLQPGTIAPSELLYPGQAFVQVVLLLIAFACVPIMLFAEPYFEYQDHHRASMMGYDTISRDSVDGNSEGGVHPLREEEEFDFSEVMVHQVIHTIEFCLGAISNTASYLRLWALSLAHARMVL